jgi:thiosulfate/3-mercaptopyruvate sulfurtransferase
MVKKNILIPFLFILCAVLLPLAGCGSSSSSTPNTAAPGTAPTVVAATPAPDSTGATPTAPITVTFSAAMDTSTINGSTFIVKDAGNNAASGTISCSGATATFTPSANLDYLMPYTATITTGAKDAAGNPLTAGYTLHFITASTPSPLIDAAVLKDWIDDGLVNGAGNTRVVVLDVGSAATYSAGHIPGAQFVNSTDIYQNRQEGPAVDVNMVLDGPHMDALVQKYGIDNNTTIVFTTSSILNATRAYWTFRYWGFPKDKLKVLNGFNTAWSTAYGLSTTASPAVTPSSYSVKSNASLRTDLRASLSEMMSVASGSVSNAVILDSRSTSTSGSYAGTPGSTAGVFSPSGDYVVFEGHMKGAKALDYTTMYDSTLQFKSPDVLTAMLAAVGIDGTKTTYTHCRTGVIASLSFFVLDAILDWPVEDYDGSWSQWGQLSADSANGGMLAADSPWRTDIPALSEVVVYNHATKAVEELALDGSVCSSTLSTTNVITYSSSCTPSAPDSYATSGNQVEEADAAYMGH